MCVAAHRIRTASGKDLLKAFLHRCKINAGSISPANTEQSYTAQKDGHETLKVRYLGYRSRLGEAEAARKVQPYRSWGLDRSTAPQFSQPLAPASA